MQNLIFISKPATHKKQDKKERPCFLFRQTGFLEYKNIQFCQHSYHRKKENEKIKRQNKTKPNDRNEKIKIYQKDFDGKNGICKSYFINAKIYV